MISLSLVNINNRSAYTEQELAHLIKTKFESQVQGEWSLSCISEYWHGTASYQPKAFPKLIHSK